MKIAVVGADGQLGTDVVKAFTANGDETVSLTHSDIEVTDKEFERIAATDPAGVAVLAAALLIEAGYDAHLDRLVVVWCRPEQQIVRLTDHASGRGMTRAEADHRIAAQMPLDRKKAMADDLIAASGTLDATRRQVSALVARLKRLAAEGTAAAEERIAP